MVSRQSTRTPTPFCTLWYRDSLPGRQLHFVPCGIETVYQDANSILYLVVSRQSTRTPTPFCTLWYRDSLPGRQLHFVPCGIETVYQDAISILYLVVSRQSTRTPTPFCTLWYRDSLPGRQLHFVPCGIETVYQDANFFFLICIYDNVICKPEVGSNSSSDADTTFMVIQCLTRNMLKRVGESRHLCRVPTVVLNQSPVPPLNGTALWASSYKNCNDSYDVGIDFLIVAHKASCHTLLKAFLKYVKTW